MGKSPTHKSRTSTKPGPSLDAETLRGKMHGETNGRTLQGACHMVRGLPWPRLDCGLQAIRRLVKLFGRCARKCSRPLNLASSSLHDLTCVRFVAFSILCLTLRYISEYSSSSNLVKPAIYRSILRWVLASFSTTNSTCDQRRRCCH